jgi:hypothetical protein
MPDAVVYIVIAAAGVLLVLVGRRTTGPNPIVTVGGQLLMVFAAVELISPLTTSAIVAVGVAYYVGFFTGGAFREDKLKRSKDV